VGGRVAHPGGRSGRRRGIGTKRSTLGPTRGLPPPSTGWIASTRQLGMRWMSAFRRCLRALVGRPYPHRQQDRRRGGSVAGSSPMISRRVGGRSRLCTLLPRTGTISSIVAVPLSTFAAQAVTGWAGEISKSVPLRVLCSNCALSPRPQKACRSCRDSQSFSCGVGTPHTRGDSSSQ
jgi:hypothetical protein